MMLMIWGLSSGRMEQQQHTHKKEIEKEEENKEQKQLLQLQHKNTYKKGEAYKKNEREELKETTAEHTRDKIQVAADR